MSAIDDINAQKNAALQILDAKILAARTQRNAGVPPALEAKLDQAIEDLQDQRQAVFDQAFEGALNSDAMAKALAALRSATADMNKVAAQMTTATKFVANAAALLDAADKVTTALKG